MTSGIPKSRHLFFGRQGHTPHPRFADSRPEVLNSTGPAALVISSRVGSRVGISASTSLWVNMVALLAILNQPSTESLPSMHRKIVWFVRVLIEFGPPQQLRGMGTLTFRISPDWTLRVHMLCFRFPTYPLGFKSPVKDYLRVLGPHPQTKKQQMLQIYPKTYHFRSS